jgi:hypothetical protein
MHILRGVWWTLTIGVRLVWNVASKSDLAISLNLKDRGHETHVCLVPSSQVSRPGPSGNSPSSTLLTAPETLLEAASASFRIEADFMPPADLTSQHRTVESRLPETKTDDSAENDREVIWP